MSAIGFSTLPCTHERLKWTGASQSLIGRRLQVLQKKDQEASNNLMLKIQGDGKYLLAVRSVKPRTK